LAIHDFLFLRVKKNGYVSLFNSPFIITASMRGLSHPDISETYIHPHPPSFKSKVLKILLTVIGKKKEIERNFKTKKFSSEAAPLPEHLKKGFPIDVQEVDKRRVWILNEQNRFQNLIIYIHGGGYVSNITKYDWNLIGELLRKTGSIIVVPDYPLAPTSNYQDVYQYFDMLYSSLLSKYPQQNIVFMGNSAGGGIALGFAQKLRNEKRRQPSQIILISPWLDLTLSHPDILRIDKKDRSLGIEGLTLAAQAYRANLPITDYKVSPIYGGFSELGKISLFIGTHDIFLPDARKFKEKMEVQNIAINYFEYPAMFHVWIAVTDLKESRHAIKQISDLINGDK